MDIAELLRGVQSGACSVEDAVQQLKMLPYENLGFARVDHHRQLRQGFAEVIFCSGKTPEQTARIAQSLAEGGSDVLATRAEEAHFAAVSAVLPGAVYHRQARAVTVLRRPPVPRGLVAVCAAGTADLPVAEEAALTAEVFGCRVERLYDIGIAGIHRLFDVLPLIRRANCVVTVAGMEGALAGVVGGLVERPVVAVPTSVGYGANFGGLSALLTMLNTCAAGVGVVNIDNGFGAGYLAAQINRLAKGEESDENAVPRV